MVTTSASMPPPPRSCRFTFRPTVPKKIGARNGNTIDSSLRTVSCFSSDTWRNVAPAMNAPNTAWMPIHSVVAPQASVTTIRNTRSAVRGARPTGDRPEQAAGDRVQHHAGEQQEGPGQGQRGQHLNETDMAVRGHAGDQGQHQPADRVVHHARRQDDHADVSLGQIQVHQDLGDDRHGRDGHGGGQEKAEQDPAVGLGQVGVRSQQAQAEAGGEREHHPHQRGDQRRPPQMPQQAQVGLQTGQRQQQHHAGGAERLQQVELRWIGGKIAAETSGK